MSRREKGKGAKSNPCSSWQLRKFVYVAVRFPSAFHCSQHEPNQCRLNIRQISDYCVLTSVNKSDITHSCYILQQLRDQCCFKKYIYFMLHMLQFFHVMRISCSLSRNIQAVLSLSELLQWKVLDQDSGSPSSIHHIIVMFLSRPQVWPLWIPCSLPIKQ